MYLSRRDFNKHSLHITAALVLVRAGSFYDDALALSLNDLSNADAVSGLKTALVRGTSSAIESLGKMDGFLGNPRVRISLPSYMENAAKVMRSLGQGAHLDDLVTSMNRAAEQAVPAAKSLLVKTVQEMSVTDAKSILSDGDGAATKFFAEKTRAPLGVQFLPIVTKATEKVGLAEKYNNIASKLQAYGLVKPEEANIQRYVTGKSLDGLYVMMGDEERKIRQYPIGTGSAILSKVFSSLR